MKANHKAKCALKYALCCVLVGCALNSQSSAAVSVGVGYSNGGANISFRYDSTGFPIWGYASNGSPIYGYDPYGRPIFVVNQVYRGCYVPYWRPAPYYRGYYRYPANVYYVNYNHPSYLRYNHNYRVLPVPPSRPAYNPARGRYNPPSASPRRQPMPPPRGYGRPGGRYHRH